MKNYRNYINYILVILVLTVINTYGISINRIIEDIKQGSDISRFISDKNINKKDRYGFSLLHHGVLSENMQAIDILINSGANINAKDCNENTPLHIAAYKNNFIIIKKLLDNRADSDIKNIYGKTAADLIPQDSQTYLYILNYYNSL